MDVECYSEMAIEGRTATPLGARIREARKHSEFTLATLATKAGVHANTISNIEHGKSVPTKETLNSIATALGRSVEDLCGPAPARPPEEQAVITFLQGFRAQAPDLFRDWSEAMWERYLALGTRFGVANDAAAQFFADQVRREFRCIEQLRDLFDANRADEVISVLSREHARWRASVEPAAAPETRTDQAHSMVPTPHDSSPAAARRKPTG